MAEDAEVGSVSGGDCKDKTVKRLLLTFRKSNGSTSYLTLKARLAFIQLKKAFTKAPILWHFDLKCYIRIETDASGYAIGGVLSKLTLDNLGQWHLVVFYLQKMIPAKTRYKTYNNELLAIIEAFKTWRHYLKGCKYKIFILTITTIYAASWIQKVWALGRSVRPKSFSGIIFELIITSTRQMGLQIHCFVFLRETRIKKKSFGQRILKFFIACSPH